MKFEVSNAARLPTRFGKFTTVAFKEYLDDKILEHLVVFTDPLPKIPLVRVHSECLTGDVFGSMKCDCGPELALAMGQIKDAGGMLIYLRQEGRGIGLFNKINAYCLQDKGYDTVEANEALGFAKDAREYSIVGEIFKHFNIEEIKLLTNNPRKVDEMSKYAKVHRESIIIKPNEYNEKYLQDKKKKLGHML
ncbi:GTP cyclohydrolase II [Helicobacter sp. 13S00401-1]|uniref:GTP cyclohydrolase II n=1 Tax=Helicobacter sp. 13S00401-1 TaxID=1905758 RepID=UPI000BA5F9E8|nr:GTP cyclohydrolase II [Helicobacter sp. 13S00401-1]PAF48980.1 GTP cyclohydrolase II [Helicobacter sp. 13S00401-1]